MTPNRSRRLSRSQSKSLGLFMAAIALFAFGFYISDAVSKNNQPQVEARNVSNSNLAGLSASTLTNVTSAAVNTLPSANAASSGNDISAPNSGKSLLDSGKLGEPLPRNLFVELFKLVNPTVVSITTTQNARLKRSRYRDPMQDFLEQFMGPGFQGQQMAPQPAQGLGTGFIVRSDGLIITNNHVVDGADVIRVQLDNDSKKSFEATIIGRDKRTDIALIKIDAKRPLPTATLGSSSSVQVGEWVAAFGNPYGHEHTMTKGVISAIGREIGEINRFPFLQTDASINPGNSGGPLVNTQGYVIGVNTAIDARAQGIGFAIPIDNVKQIVKQLEEKGQVSRGFIGVGLIQLDPQTAQGLGLESTDGVVVTQVQPGSPAEKAGIKVYDIIVEFAGKKIATASDLSNAVGDSDIGKKAQAKVLRLKDSKLSEKTLDVVIGEDQREAKANKSAEAEVKKFFGQKAPFDLGFNVADFSEKLAQEFEIPPGSLAGPIVTDVLRGTAASRTGLREGDVILDVNRQSVKKATDVIKALRQGQNILRIARGPDAFLIMLEAK